MIFQHYSNVASKQKLYNAFVTCCAAANQNGWSFRSSQDSSSKQTSPAKTTPKRKKPPKMSSEVPSYSRSRAGGGSRSRTGYGY